jgi:hypothetical protein
VWGTAALGRPGRAKPGSKSNMIYTTSMLAGLLAVLVACISLPVLAVVGLIVYSMIHPPQEGEGAVGWDPVSLVHQQPLPILALIVLVFAAGFFWEFRRLTHR